jgi:NAD-dependent deacetylase
MMASDPIATLRTWFDEGEHLVFLTGAGISTESGIPDFRSASGIYSRGVNTNVFDVGAFYQDPSLYYGFAREFCDITDRAEPNEAHQAIAALGRRPRKQVSVITQNIDDLHQRAGSDPVWCVHGNLEWSKCLRCGARLKTVELMDVIRRGEVPTHDCGGVFKPEVTFFGEMLPERDFSESQRAIAGADLLVVVGSSLTVYPAAGLPFGRSRKCRYVVINRDETDQDHSADLVIHDTAGDVLHAAVFHSAE